MSEETIAKRAPIQEAPVGPEAGARAETLPGGGAKEGPLTDVFFDFDKAILSNEAKKSLDDNTKWLKANPAVRIVVQGHCDERGTTEYNLALGERRAQAVKSYLTSLGIDGSRLSTISYGEERPVDPAHHEESWALNRRAEFKAM
jgi:peptidoglycan-associated lipoprotein